MGKLEEAERAYAWFTTYYNRAPRVSSAEDLVFVSRGVAEHARWTRNSGQFRRLVNEVLPAAVAREPNFWPAHLESALLYLEKYNEADAAAEIRAGLGDQCECGGTARGPGGVGAGRGLIWRRPRGRSTGRWKSIRSWSGRISCGRIGCSPICGRRRRWLCCGGLWS